MEKQSESTQKIQEALALLNEAAREKKDELGALLCGRYEDLKKSVLNMQEGVVGQAKQGMQKAEDLGRAVAEKAKEAAATLDRKAHEEPWKTVGWSVAGAFLVGFLLGRRHK